MALNSPGVEVTVNDDSFYVPAEPGTRPLIIVATTQNKTSGSTKGTAVGTLAANAGKPYILTSQRDLSDIFGTPMFWTDSSKNPIHGGELNEYGLQAAYSFLGVSNSAYVIRADIDLDQLSPLATAPNSNPIDGQYWLSTKDTHFGIFEWNSSAPTVSGGQKFANKIPTVITDETKLDGFQKPLESIGKIGDYAVVSVTSINKIYFKNTNGHWVLLGSPEWAASNAAVQGTKTNPTLLSTDSMIINGVTVTVPVGPDTDVAGLAGAITDNLDIGGITAAAVNGRLEIYIDDPLNAILIEKGNGTLVDSELSTSKLGIVTGFYYAPQLTISPHTSVPLYKTVDHPEVVNGVPSGSIWIKTTNVNLGAHWIVKLWDEATKAWKIVEAPVYANNQAALYGLDRAGGGKNLPRGVVYVQFNIDEEERPLGTFSLFRRELPNPTTVISEVITDTTFNKDIRYGFKIAESYIGSPNLKPAIDVTFVATSEITDASNIASAINAAGFDSIVASVNTRNQVVIVHETGGEFRLKGDIAVSGIGGTSITGAATYNNKPSKYYNGSTWVDATARFDIIKSGALTNYNGSNTVIIEDPNNPADFTPGTQIKILGTQLGGTTPANDLIFTFINSLNLIFGNPFDANDNSGTPNFYTSPVGDMDSDYIVSNWKPLKAKQSDVVPSQIPLDGRLWYNPAHTADIMIHNGSTWVSYLDDTSPYYSINQDKQTDPNGPLIRATKPTTQSDGTELVTGDLWLDTGDMDNYPSLYKYDKYNLKWIPVDSTDQTTEDGILFADARYNTDGENSDEPGDIVDLLNSNFLDPDAPDPDLYPRGMLLFNTRRSGNNVKKFVRNYINPNSTNIRMNDASQLYYYPHRWVNESGNAPDGHGLFGRFAQRKVVVSKLKALVDTNQLIRDQELRTFNLIACPGYPELIQNMVNLNFDRKQTAFVIGDSPFRLPSDATSIMDWGSHVKLSAVDNGEEALITHDEYLGVYYPSGMTTDNGGNKIVVPASHMVLRSIALSDGVSFPWFAPAGTRRGKVSNATSVGYIDAATGEWQSISLNEGQRDTLYSVSVNPITELTGSGIVIFGQKTRSSEASSLDRINVARLVVYLRSQLSKLARPYMFEPNDKITRSELKSAAESIMLELMGHRGIYDYLVICDETNNTPSRIDRNELYLDIAIEPMKAVEFIYIPLRLKNTGEIAGLGK